MALEKSRSGLGRVGYIKNYKAVMACLSGLMSKANIDQKSFDSCIESQIDEPKSFLDAEGEVCSRDQAVMRVFHTPLKIATGEEVFISFVRSDVDREKWVGAEVVTPTGALDLTASPTEFRLVSGGDMKQFETALFKCVEAAPCLLAEIKQNMRELGFQWEGKIKPVVNSMNSVAVARDHHPQPVDYLVRRDRMDNLDYLTAEPSFIPSEHNCDLEVEEKHYDSLYKRYKEQNPSDVFAFFQADGDDFDAPFKELAHMAQKGEKWESNSFPSGNVEVLKNYLNYTFCRLQEEGKILYSENGEWSCFNTGLLTEYGKDILATFRRPMGDYPTPWRFYRFCDMDNANLHGFSMKPEVASYYTDITDLFFDLSYDLRWNTDHIVQENAERLPRELQGNPRLAALAIKGALDDIKNKLRRNYKLAVPHWYHKQSRLQLLLPLYLLSDTVADVAVIAEKDVERKCYNITTVLTKEMAYVDARLICRPDGEWLNFERNK